MTPPIDVLDATTAVSNDARFVEGVMGMDFVTIGLAFRRFAEYAEIPLSRIKTTPAGGPLIARLNQYTNDDYSIHDVTTDVQDEDGRESLNQLATDHGFDKPYSDQFGPQEVGVVAIVDKKMKWHEGDAEGSSIATPDLRRFKGVRFKLSPANDEHFSVYQLPEFNKPVVRIAANPAESDGVQNYLWATELPFSSVPTFDELFDLLRIAIKNAHSENGTPRESSEAVATIRLPKLEDLTYTRSLDEVIGAELDEWLIIDASQSLRVKIDEFGAEAAAITTMVGWMRSARPKDPRRHIVLGDTGFLLVWFTEGTSTIPICALVATTSAFEPEAEAE